MNMSESSIHSRIEKLENKFYGKYKGRVIDNNDPENRGRIKAIVPNILEGDNWCEPCVPYVGLENFGFFMVPEIDSWVWIEFQAGELSLPIWGGGWWPLNKTPQETRDKQDQSVKLIKTKSGHMLIFDDTDGEPKIILKDSESNEIQINTKDNEIKITSAKAIKLDSTEITINSSSNTTIEAGGTLTLKGTTINLN